MGGTKIFVFKLKTIVTVGAAVVAAAALAAAAIMLVVGRNAKNPTVYHPGTYQSYIILHNKPVAVDVTVSKTEIIAIELKDMDVAQQLSYPLFKPMMAEISREVIRRQSTDVALAVDTHVTGRILLDAVDAAIGKAIKN